MKIQFGRHFYGIAGIAFGVITIVSHQIDALGSVSHPGVLVYFAGIIEVVGGLAIQWKRTGLYGALALGGMFLVFTISLIPDIVAAPLVYGNWGNFFEEFSIVLGGVFVLAAALRNDSEKRTMIATIAYACFGVCAVSFSLYQLFYLPYTANLVPVWIPPGQMFWAIATTIAFGLAAFAVISGRSALLASRLLVTMLIGFGLLIWTPSTFIHPHELRYWISNAENLIVASSVWIVADFISQSRAVPVRWFFVHTQEES